MSVAVLATSPKENSGFMRTLGTIGSGEMDNAGKFYRDYVLHVIQVAVRFTSVLARVLVDVF